MCGISLSWHLAEIGAECQEIKNSGENASFGIEVSTFAGKKITAYLHEAAQLHAQGYMKTSTLVRV
jgi:hypothetical protein